MTAGRLAIAESFGRAIITNTWIEGKNGIGQDPGFRGEFKGISRIY